MPFEIVVRCHSVYAS